MKLPVTSETFSIGEIVSVQVGKIVHGGHFIAHSGGRTIFVRGAIDGETVQVRITARRKKVYFGEVVAIVTPSAYRVEPPCASSPECGGCDFQYVDIGYQRTLKAKVLHESLEKFSGLEHEVIDQLVEKHVRDLQSGDQSGLNWRHRSRFVWSDGWHMRRHSSHDLVPTPDCKIITTEMRRSLGHVTNIPDGQYVIAEGENGVSIVSETSTVSGPSHLKHSVFDAHWKINPQGFWQADPLVITAIAEFMDELVTVNQGDTWWDLYGGAGVFAAYLSGRVGNEGHVTTVDSDVLSYESAVHALSDHGNISIIRAHVKEFLDVSPTGSASNVHGVVIDPPRSGAGESVIRMIMDREPKSIVYIACDPVALSRDLKFLGEKYQVTAIRAWDAFPMSHHFETVALLT